MKSAFRFQGPPAGPASCALLVACCIASSASAFRPSGRWLLQQAAERQLARKIKTLRVEREATVYGLPEAPKGLRVEERTYFRAPGSMRGELELPAGQRVVWVTDKKQAVREPGTAWRTTRGLPKLAIHFLAAGTPWDVRKTYQRWLADLAQMKVDLDTVAFGRFHGRVAYIVGAKAGQEDRPQIWLDKDSLLLLRIVQRAPAAEAGGSLWQETRLLGYGSPEGGSWFPKVIEEREAGRLVKRSVTLGVDKNVSLSAALFQ